MLTWLQEKNETNWQELPVYGPPLLPDMQQQREQSIQEKPAPQQLQLETAPVIQELQLFPITTKQEEHATLDISGKKDCRLNKRSIRHYNVTFVIGFRSSYAKRTSCLMKIAGLSNS